MKRILLLLVATVLGVLPSSAQLTLAQKRANLVWSMRLLGPVAPVSWPNSWAVIAPNYDSVLTDNTFRAQGNFQYTTAIGSEYFFAWANSGLWLGGNASYTGSPLRFDHYGLHENRANPYPDNYHFSLDANSYNIAGLRYQGLRIYLSGTSYYAITPGQAFHTLGLFFDSGRSFDLAQNVETPTFAVTDYWFGPGMSPHNYPVDAKVPTPQNTASQSQNALLIAPLNQFTTNIAWVQEGVYRPGFTLQPGYSSPRLQTYMEQYFNAAWKTDPVTGQPPRTATLNWNSVGRINTATAVPAGILYTAAPYNGIYYFATNFGKVILTTVPQENGHYGEFPAYTLAALVDRNRDGTLDLKDTTTSASNPHTFWLNNDCDRAVYEEHNGWDEDETDASLVQTNDAQFVRAHFRIPSLRDLEDYDRLHIRGLRELCRDLPTGQSYTVKLRWKSVQSGNPGIFVFKAAGGNGNRGYLTNQSTANAQIIPTIYPPSGPVSGLSPLAIGRVESGISPVLHNDASRGTNDFFIYCGTSRGAGELAATVYKNDQFVSETSVFLDIRDVKELYERWTVGEGKGTEPTTNATLFSGSLPSGASAPYFTSNPANSTYILLVHGWNMTPDCKDSFSETSFKRLYWQGYTNRFGAFRWPTDYNFDGQRVWDALTDAGNFNRSEFIGWKSGTGLRNLLTNLNSRFPGKVYMVSHSQGAIPAGEALALHAEKFGGGQIVNTYVASQAAVSMQCYSATNNSPFFQMMFAYKHPKQEEFGNSLALWPGYGWILGQLNGPINWDSGTPNIFRGWLETNRASSQARVNFYNPHDYALNMPVWGFNQLLKPDVSDLNTTYKYTRFPANKPLPRIGGTGAAQTPTAFLIPSPARSGSGPAMGIRQREGYFRADTWFSSRALDFEFKLNDMYEAMAFGAESRTMPLGTAWSSAVLEQQVDVRDLWPPDTDPDPINGTHGRHKWHSGQFRSNFIVQGTYWAVLLGQRGFSITETE